MHFNIIGTSTSTASEWSIPVMVSNQLRSCFSPDGWAVTWFNHGKSGSKMNPLKYSQCYMHHLLWQ
jgi:hypothetical protein